MLPPFLEDENSGPSELLVATYSIYLNARQLYLDNYTPPKKKSMPAKGICIYPNTR
jgi:hypothetical protein